MEVNDEHTLLMKTIARIENCNVKEMRFEFSCEMKIMFVFNDVILVSLHAMKYVVYTVEVVSAARRNLFRGIAGILVDCVIDRDVEVSKVWCHPNRDSTMDGSTVGNTQRQYMHRLLTGSREQIIEFHL